ncbi:MAG: indolepyruvate oxidoreductase subunit beta [Actinobacteria bacterium]|nr:indolepyruvate oxidoreductase subunit beta [Actinomycetota bacterium]
MVTDVVLAGVGGQGNVLSARILAEAAMRAGYRVKTSEVHGMAQRGGSVVCMVRWGEEVYSPLIPRGRADFLLAYELLEGLRFLEYLRPGGTAVVNDYRLDPLPVLRGDAAYPEDALGLIREASGKCVVLRARDLAEEAGSARAVGTVMLGALSVFLQFPRTAWEDSLRQRVPPRALEANLRAFEMGRKAAG